MYEDALKIYREGQFNVAIKKFNELLEKQPTDMPSIVLKERCSQYIETPPSNWIGIHEMDQK